MLGGREDTAGAWLPREGSALGFQGQGREGLDCRLGISGFRSIM